MLFKPKDIVSGDFYWIYQYNDSIYFAVGDCTGHGIPGALVNIAGNTILRQIIRTEGFDDPALILRCLIKSCQAFSMNTELSGQKETEWISHFVDSTLDQ